MMNSRTTGAARHVLYIVAALALAIGCYLIGTIAPAAHSAPPSPPHHRLASCYGPGLYGNHTANGTVLTRHTLGVAMRSARLGSRITLAANGHRVTVRVIDRGPYVGGRSVDVTSATARALGFRGRLDGCAHFGVRVLRSSI